MKPTLKLLTLCAAGVALVACGGDKADPAGREISYAGSTSALVISSANVATIASLADAAAFSSLGSASGGPSYAGAAAAARRIGPEAALAFLQKTRRDGAVALAGAYGSATEACTGGGTVSVTASTASDTVATVGDFIELSAKRCDDGQGSIVSGTLRMEITGTDGVDPSLGPSSMTSGVTYGMRLVVTDFSVEDASGWVGMEGDMEFSQVWNAATFRLQSSIQGGSFVAATGIGSTVTDASLITAPTLGGQFSMTAVEEYTDAYATTLYATESGMDAKLCSLEMNGCIGFQTSQPVRQLETQLYPAAGSVTVYDQVGHYIQLVPTDGSTGAVTVSWEIVAGSPTPDGTCYTTWDTMSTDTCFP